MDKGAMLGVARAEFFETGFKGATGGDEGPGARAWRFEEAAGTGATMVMVGADGDHFSLVAGMCAACVWREKGVVRMNVQVMCGWVAAGDPKLGFR